MSFLAVGTTIWAWCRLFRLVLLLYFMVNIVNYIQEEGMMETNDYFVIGLWEGIWDKCDPAKYFRGFLQDKEDMIGRDREVLAGFDNYLGIIMSPPTESMQWSYADFNRWVIYLKKYLYLNEN